MRFLIAALLLYALGLFAFVDYLIWQAGGSVLTMVAIPPMFAAVILGGGVVVTRH